MIFEVMQGKEKKNNNLVRNEEINLYLIKQLIVFYIVCCIFF
jgi:hypothetical protein